MYIHIVCLLLGAEVGAVGVHVVSSMQWLERSCDHPVTGGMLHIEDIRMYVRRCYVN